MYLPPFQCIPAPPPPPSGETCMCGPPSTARAQDTSHGLRAQRRNPPSPSHTQGAGLGRLRATASGIATPGLEHREREERPCGGLQYRRAHQTKPNQPPPPPPRLRSVLERLTTIQRGGGVLWHFNFAWEISRFKLTAKFPTRNSGFSANFSHTSSTHCGLWRG